MSYLIRNNGRKIRNLANTKLNDLIQGVNTNLTKGFRRFAINNAKTVNSTNSETGKKSEKTGQGKNKQKQEETSQSKSSSRLSAVAFLSVPIITFSLGVWQINRRNSKLEQIEYFQNLTRSRPVDLPTDRKELENFVQKHEYKPFKVKGYFLHSKEVILSMRHDLTQQTNVSGGYVITPFALSSDPNLIILVNRGFVPYTNFSPRSRSAAQIETEVEIIGILRSNEPSSWLKIDNSPPNEWHFRNVKEMSEALGTLPIYLDAVKSTSVVGNGAPIAGQTSIDIKNNHLKYIIASFGLTVLISTLWWRRFKNLLF